MKKISLSLITLLVLIIFTRTVNAAEITSAKYKNDQIQIIGTGTGQVQIVLFNSKNVPMYMTTINSENGKFNITLPKIENLEVGNYKVKVANYDGGDVNEKALKIEDVKDDTPKTGNLAYNGIATFISIISVLGITILKAKQV